VSKNGTVVHHPNLLGIHPAASRHSGQEHDNRPRNSCRDPPPVAFGAMSASDLTTAATLVDLAAGVVDTAVHHLAATGSVDTDQILAYDLAHVAAAVATARSMLHYGARGDVEAALSCVFVADALHDLAAKLFGREALWGLARGPLTGAEDFVSRFRDPTLLAELSGTPGPRHLEADYEMVQDTFRRFGDERIKPHAEHVHRTNADVPEDIISGLGEIGAFGLSCPAAYGGFSEGGEGEYLAMVVATEELSRASLGIGGSLITRPEILTRALVRGGTEAQKQRWLPPLATGQIMAAVAVTEPDFGSDVAGVLVTATAATSAGGEPGYAINGVKTWCTFAARADVLMLLARTDPDRSKTHRGLSVFVVPKPRGSGHGFEFAQPDGGRMQGRAIDTLGYRGMHSYEVAFENWWVPADCLIGEEGGVGKGFYYQMEGFENGRLQTAARAVGVMQAAYEAALDYAENRTVFGRKVGDYQLTKAKLTRMAVVIQASRQAAYEVAALMGRGEGAMEASMVKAYVCKAAEWVTREALQIHGGYGYAEEYAVSRLYVDARVLSIFEGADETLCLKVIARRLVEQAGASPVS
jgi:(2S)-methylsuccinyl-CoA dehydrogenase